MPVIRDSELEALPLYVISTGGVGLVVLYVLQYLDHRADIAVLNDIVVAVCAIIAMALSGYTMIAAYASSRKSSVSIVANEFWHRAVDIKPWTARHTFAALLGAVLGGVFGGMVGSVAGSDVTGALIGVLTCVPVMLAIVKPISVNGSK